MVNLYFSQHFAGERSRILPAFSQHFTCEPTGKNTVFYGNLPIDEHQFCAQRILQRVIFFVKAVQSLSVQNRYVSKVTCFYSNSIFDVESICHQAAGAVNCFLEVIKAIMGEESWNIADVGRIEINRYFVISCLI